MHFFKITIYIPLCLLLATSTKSSNSYDFCTTQVCSYDEPVSRYVKFPFLIRNESLPQFCGYPGFDLLCDDHQTLLINLPNSGVFSVKAINYIDQELWLNDPDDCLPKKFLTLNNSNYMGESSPFARVFEQDYWFYNCSNEFFNTSYVEITPIKCLSEGNYGVFVTTVENYVNYISNFSLCSKIGPIKMPIALRSSALYNTLVLEEDILLTWNNPSECSGCYVRNGKCRFENGSGSKVECFNLPRQGISRSVMFGISIAFVTPIVLVTCCIAYFITKALSHRRRTNRARLQNFDESIFTWSQQPERVMQGLDKTTIESYPKVVLGESRRLPKPDDNSCAICLGEYLAKETLKTIPDCGHCFHADCIDEWLLLNASCPVCRNSPSKTSQPNA